MRGSRAPPQPPIDQVMRQALDPRVSPAYIEAQRLFVIKLALPGSEDNLRDEHVYLLNPQFRHPRLLSLYEPNRGDSTTERRRGFRGSGYLRQHPTTGQRLDLPYITLPYVLGGSLKELGERRNSEVYPPAAAVRIAIQIGEAVQYLHNQMGLVHQDISPSNVLLRTRLSSLRALVPDCILIDLAVADAPRNPKAARALWQKDLSATRTLSQSSCADRLVGRCL